MFQNNNGMSNSTVDNAFRQIPHGKPYFQIWRIEDLQLIPVPKPQWGSFYKGDAYILYNVIDERGSLTRRIHFWLGSESTQDEQGAAAIKTVELDNYLGGEPVQYREVEGHESQEFLSYFRKGIRYNDGGVKSGFRHVDRDHFEPKLYQVKGKRHPRWQQVPMTWESFNHGDVFINDQGKVLFVWIGVESNRCERIKAMEIARGIRDERGVCNLIVIEDGEALDEKYDKLWSPDGSLPYLSQSVKSSSAAEPDDAHDRNMAQQIKLYRCTDESGTLRVSEIASAPLEYKMLDTNDVFIVDNSNAGVWVWCGKGSSRNEKKAAMSNALSFVEKLGRHSKSVQVIKMHEGGETSKFKTFFRGWPPPTYSGQTCNNNKIAKTVQTRFDASTLHSNIKMSSQTKLVDDGSGRVQIWRVENYRLVEVDPAIYGHFYGGDSYVIHYVYIVGNRDEHILYYWQGRKSSQDERGSAALLTTQMDDEMGGSATQVRVTHGKEPPHFLAIFQGKLIIYEGGKAGWNKAEKDQAIGETYLLRINGTSSINTKAEQVPAVVSSLNSNDTFVLVTKTHTFIWCGKGTTGDEREMAKTVAKSVSRRGYILLSETQESDIFWTALGGKGEYSCDKRLQQSKLAHPPRLFQCSNASGKFNVEEIDNFIQDDLVEDDVMLLDTWEEVFVWVGASSNEEEKKNSMLIACNYLETDPSQERSDDTPIYKVKQGSEPPIFTGFFPKWDYSLWSNCQTYEELKSKLGDQTNFGLEEVDSNHLVKSLETQLSFSDCKKFSYDDLKSGTPSGVRPDEKEYHLTAEDFQKYFKMNFQEFITLPEWKKAMLKKRVYLF